VEALSYGEALVCDRESCIECFCCAEVCPAGALSKKF
jgi:NAD-dependent dihydropyrimidine dehydrogenase PreA subunit